MTCLCASLSLFALPPLKMVLNPDRNLTLNRFDLQAENEVHEGFFC